MVTPRPKAPKTGRPTAKRRVEGRAWTRGKLEICVYISDDLLARCNDAFMKSNHRYFSRWVSSILEEAISK